MPVSSASVEQLRSKCNLPAKTCRTALTQSKGDVDAALASLIDAGKVKPTDLNPDTVSDELFERAARLEKLKFYQQFTNPKAGLFGALAKLGETVAQEGASDNNFTSALLAYREQLYGNKTPEQMMADDEARDAARLKQLYKTTPGLKRQKPMTPGQQARLMAETTRRSARLKGNPLTLKLPPFPPLKREMHEWTGKDVIPAFAGTQERHGPYTSRSSRKPSKGSVTLEIPRLDDNDTSPAPPAKEQLAAYAYFKEHQAEVTQAIMQALLKDYTRLRRRWLKSDPDLDLPDITTPDDMRHNVGLGTLHLFDVAKAGVAYFGLELGCTWDEEHGAGVILHKNRVVAVGQADTSFTPDYATEDGGKKITRKPEPRNQKPKSKGKAK